MGARAERLRGFIPAGLANPDWTDRRLPASIGEAAAARADAVLVEVLARPDAAAREHRRLTRRGPAMACPWYARLVGEIAETDGAQRAARLALAAAVRDLAESYPRRRIQLPPAWVWRATLNAAGRDLRNLVLALIMAYAATFVGAAAAIVGSSGALVGADAARIAGVQVQLALPVLVVLGCLLVRPRSWAAEYRARLVVYAAGGVAAYLAWPGSGRLRVPLSGGPQDVLRDWGEAVLRHLPMLSRPGMAVAVAGIVTAIVITDLPLTIRAGGRLAPVSAAVKGVFIAVTAWWVLAVSPGDLPHAIRALADLFAAAGLP
jgi:hypothetical protein